MECVSTDKSRISSASIHIIMRKRTIIIPTLLLLLSCFCACGGGNNKEDIPYGFKEAAEFNDSTQRVFFNTPYGASKEELISNFDFAGFSVDTQKSTDDLLYFKYRDDKHFGFEGKGWENLEVYFVNDKFCEIIFFNIFDDEDKAMKDYDDLLKKISKTYKMTEMEPWNNETCRSHVAISHMDGGMSIHCDSCTTSDKKKQFSVNLHYADNIY